MRPCQSIMKKEMRREDSTPTTPVHGGATTISDVHPDILQTHILTRLNGTTLASAACSSSHLHALSTQDTLWQQLCYRTWPSTADPRLRRLISSSFPRGHQSFYSDSIQYLDHHRRQRSRPSRRPPPPYIISAVDIHYKDQLILSKVHVTETGSDPSLPFMVDLLGPKESLLVPVNLDIRDDKCFSNLYENMTLSWILIDPTRGRAANVSSRKPVLVRRVNWLADDVEFCYATVLAGGEQLVQCFMGVTSSGGGGGGGLVVVEEVRLRVVDMEGRRLGWRSLEAAVVEGGRRRRGEERERFEWWWREERERRRRKRRRESRRDTVVFATAVVVLLSLLATLFVLVGIKLLRLLAGLTR